MKPRKISKAALLRNVLGGIIIYFLMYALAGYLGGASRAQDACFLAGLVFIMLVLARFTRVLGLFDLLSYGYNRTMIKIKLKYPPDDKSLETYHDFVKSLERSIALEPLFPAVFFLGVFLWIRMS